MWSGRRDLEDSPSSTPASRLSNGDSPLTIGALQAHVDSSFASEAPQKPPAAQKSWSLKLGNAVESPAALQPWGFAPSQPKQIRQAPKRSATGGSAAGGGGGVGSPGAPGSSSTSPPARSGAPPPRRSAARLTGSQLLLPATQLHTLAVATGRAFKTLAEKLKFLRKPPFYLGAWSERTSEHNPAASAAADAGLHRSRSPSHSGLADDGEAQPSTDSQPKAFTAPASQPTYPFSKAAAHKRKLQADLKRLISPMARLQLWNKHSGQPPQVRLACFFGKT